MDRKASRATSSSGWMIANIFCYKPLLLFRLLEELNQVILPDCGLRVGAVSAGGVGDGDEDELGVRHFRHELLGDAELRRVDEVVSGVDPEDRSGDRAELWFGVVIARGVDVI